MNYKKQFIIAIIVSFVAHLLTIFSFHYFPLGKTPEDISVLELFLEKPDSEWNLADIPEPMEQKKPTKSKFLGMYDQSVKEETVASGEKSAGSREQGAVRNPPSPPLENGGKGGFNKFDKDLFAMNTEVSEGAPITPESRVPEDFYPDFKYGEHTYLNVLRYPDVEYFVRLKRIFKTTWDPTTALRHDMAVTSVSRGMVSVVVAVSVDRAGELAELFVLKSSGLDNYDNEALRTVRASSPFSSPPEKFLKDEVLSMSWTFVVYL